MRTNKFCYSKGNECYVVVLSPGYSNLNNRLGSVSFETVNPYNEGFEHIKSFLDFSFENWDEGSLSFKQGFADMLIGMMQRYYPVTEKRDYRKNDKALFEALKYINENCKQDIDIRTLAAKFGYNGVLVTDAVEMGAICDYFDTKLDMKGMILQLISFILRLIPPTVRQVLFRSRHLCLTTLPK